MSLPLYTGMRDSVWKSTSQLDYHGDNGVDGVGRLKFDLHTGMIPTPRDFWADLVASRHTNPLIAERS